MVEWFKNLSEGWQTAIFGAGVVVALAFIGALAAFFKWIIKRKAQSEFLTVLRTTTKGDESPAQTAKDSNITQTRNLKVINYVDGVPKSQIAEVKNNFEKGREYYNKHEYKNAIHQFTLCLEIEKDSEKRGALNLQIGNCYCELRRYIKASEFYAAGLREARKANDQQGQASNLASIANTYLQRPASTAHTRGKNVRQAVQNYERALRIFKKAEYPGDCAMTQNNLGNAYIDLPSATHRERAENIANSIECYKAALEIRKKDEYPVRYATTQNNLGNAYKNLPSATPRQRAENVAYAIECYKAALEIRKKDEYPQYYCSTAANMGVILAEIDDKNNACYWLKEAYSLRQYLPDQGKRLEDVMNRVCDQK